MRVFFCSRGGGVPFDELLAQSDVISIHAPLTAETRHAFGAAELLRMKRGALLINTARGPIVDEAALAAALEAGHPRRAPPGRLRAEACGPPRRRRARRLRARAWRPSRVDGPRRRGAAAAPRKRHARDAPGDGAHRALAGGAGAAGREAHARDQRSDGAALNGPSLPEFTA